MTKTFLLRSKTPFTPQIRLNYTLLSIFRLYFTSKPLVEVSYAQRFQPIEHRELQIKNQHQSWFMIITTKQDELDPFTKVHEQPYVTFVILLPPTSVPMMGAQIDQPHPSQQDIQRLKAMWTC